MYHIHKCLSTYTWSLVWCEFYIVFWTWKKWNYKPIFVNFSNLFRHLSCCLRHKIFKISRWFSGCWPWKNRHPLMPPDNVSDALISIKLSTNHMKSYLLRMMSTYQSISSLYSKLHDHFDHVESVTFAKDVSSHLRFEMQSK